MFKGPPIWITPYTHFTSAQDVHVIWDFLTGWASTLPGFKCVSPRMGKLKLRGCQGDLQIIVEVFVTERVSVVEARRIQGCVVEFNEVYKKLNHACRESSV